MTNLVLNPTDLAQWHALVNEAQLRCSCQVHEDSQSYLVFLLMRFCQQAQLASSVIGLDFLTSVNTLGSKRNTMLRDIGDKSLLFCGLFPGIAAKRRVQLEYFVVLGQTAYCYLADLETKNNANMFALLGEEFMTLIEILQAMRNLDSTPQIIAQRIEDITSVIIDVKLQ